MFLENKYTHTNILDYWWIVNNNIELYRKMLNENKPIKRIDFDINISDQQIKNNYKRYLFDSLDLNLDLDSFTYQLYIERWYILYSWLDFVNLEQFIWSTYIGGNFRKLNFLFLEAFIEYSKELWEEEWKNFVYTFSDLFLSLKNILNDLSFEEKFIILNKLTKRKDLENISNTLRWEFNYELTFLKKEGLNNLFNIINKKWDIFWLNSINLLSKSFWVNWGYKENKINENINYLCKLISEKYNNQFFKYKLKNIENRF